MAGINIDLTDTQNAIEWLKTKLRLNYRARTDAPRLVKRGQVYQCNFGVGVGSEMRKNRPAIIVQNQVGNLRSGNTIVVPITHDISTLPCMVPIATKLDASGNVILDGQANTSNLMCVSKARLGNYIADLNAAEMKSVDIALAKTLGLMEHYADINKKLEDKLGYIEKLKEARNSAQDELKELRALLEIGEGDSIVEAVKKLK